VRTFRRFFLKFSYFLIFLNIQIDLIILETDVEQFTLTTKKAVHIIFKHVNKYDSLKTTLKQFRNVCFVFVSFHVYERMECNRTYCTVLLQFYFTFKTVLAQS